MIEEKVIVGKEGEFPLEGILTLPRETTQLFPAVVMVHGSGASNKDEQVMKLSPFKDLAEGLARYGIASLRYDKRTFAYKRKMAKVDLTVKEETIDDACAAIDLLKSDPRINHERIYILGHSMGAMLAGRIDAEGGDVKGLIMMAGTPYRLEEVVIRQLKQAQGSKGLFNWFIGFESKIFAKKFNGLYQMSDEEARKKKFAGPLSLYYFKEMGQKTAVDYLLETDKPVLIMQGGRDYQVLAHDDFRCFQDELASRDNTYFKLYPNLNHLFVEALYDDILKASKDYKVERHIGDEVFKDIAAFILENTSATDDPE